MIKWIFYILLIALVDYLFLMYYGALNQKYYVVLHLSLMLIGVILWGILKFTKSIKKDFVGLAFTGGLLIKMFVMAGIFYSLNAKFLLNKIEIINFMLIYFLYTALYVVYAVNRIKHRI